MSGIVVDTSVWIDFFRGATVPVLEAALRDRQVVATPVVIAELVSGARDRQTRDHLLGLVGKLPVHETPLQHWIDVGDLRRHLRARGLSVSTPDAHVAQTALEREGWLLSRDKVFTLIAEHTALRVWTDDPR